MENEILGFTHQYINKGPERTLLLLHGTGGDERDLLPIGETLDSQANLLSPRGKVSENGMNRFFKRLAEGIFDEEDLETRALELGEFVQKSAEHYSFSLEGVVAIGYSNGANIALRLASYRPEIFKGLVLFRAMSASLVPSVSKLSEKPVLLNAGEFDQLIPKEDSLKLKEGLKKLGSKLAFNLLAKDHRLDKEDLELARKWLESLK